MTFTAAAGVRVANKRVVIGPELYGSTVVSDGGDGFMKKRTTPVELLFGTHARLGDFQVGAGVGPGISRGVGAPDFRVVASLTWFPEPAKPQPVVPPTDRDEDGIADGADACPDVAGPKNDDPTKNGCPPPPDRDQDGIIDSEDACPDEAGPRNEDPTKNGCPPPPDRDQDGIIDSEDACPDEAGVRSDDPKKNGCPPPKDTDGDGITDDIDACVKDPGPRNEDPKKNGCPKAIMVADEVKILDRIEFDVDKATLRPESESILQAVADILQAHPEIAKIQIQGHTDNKGARAHNQNLSQRRANAVMKWLTLKGIDAKRLEARGFGQDQPIDANTTDAGRQNNRRVQFIITNKADASTQTAPGAANSGTSTGTKAP
jgi:outer membrane protein OmpA-like peptidoglycan-associated protein